MKVLPGISASPGIAIGKIYLLLDEIGKIPQYSIKPDAVDSEFSRFNAAVAKAIEEIESIKRAASQDLRPDEVNMLDTHLLMLSDPDLGEQVQKRISESHLNVEYVLSSIMRELIAKVSNAQDQYLRERSADFHDVSKRLLGNLLSRGKHVLTALDEDVIIVCKDLLPSDAVSMDKLRVKGIAMDAGGKTSHTAILARAFEIPAVLGLGDISGVVQDGEILIVDGNKGKVIIHPDDDTIAFYTRLQRDRRKRDVQLLRLNDVPAETRDGKVIKLKANIEIPEEVDAVLAHGADGIGLFRSEFLFLGHETLPDEEEQYEAYSRVLKAMGKAPVTIRTLDIGGDKLLKNIRTASSQIPGVNEKNPILGWRAIRFCLSHEDFFKTQLRAIYRASIYGNLQIMLPLISGLEEIQQSLEIIKTVKAELRERKQPYRDDVEVGIMVEVPSAAMTSDILARHSAFFSIGTNDLIQYTVAVDRGNEHIAYLYQPLHPGVLRMLKTIIDNAHACGISVCMCGQMAGEPLYALVLLGLGLDEFSMSAASIPEVKRIIRSTTLADAEEFAGRVMDLSSSSEIEAFVRSTMEERFDVTDY